MLSNHLRDIKWYGLIGMLMLPVAFAVQAKELPEGTVISASNYQQIANDTFEGHTIKSMITPAIKLQIMKYGMKMPLVHSDPKDVRFSPAWSKAMKANSGKYTLGKDHKIAQPEFFKSGRGAPFPMGAIDWKKNPVEAGWKLVWDYWFASPVRTNNWAAIGNEAMIRADKGIINRVQAVNAVQSLGARWGEGPARLGSAPNGHRNFLLVLTKPFDLAGIGIFNVQFDDGTPSAGYVYLRSLRRTRRTASGKSWVDPQPQADALNDDSGGLEGYPAWYKSWKVLDEKYILVAVTQPDDNYRDQGPVNGEFIDLNHSPHWNMINTSYQPRKVYVLQGIPPDYHPYGKKVLYEDAQYPFFYYGEFYDKNMKLWKLWYTPYAPYWNGDCMGQPGLQNFATWEADFKAQRMTYIKQTFNAHNCKELDGMSPAVLKRAASGALIKKFQKMRDRYLNKSPLPEYAKIEKEWLQKHPN